MPFWHHLEILNTVWPRDFAFPFFTGSCKFCSMYWESWWQQKTQPLPFPKSWFLFQFSSAKGKVLPFSLHKSVFGFQTSHLWGWDCIKGWLCLTVYSGMLGGFFAYRYSEEFIDFQWSWPQIPQCFPNPYLLPNPSSGDLISTLPSTLNISNGVSYGQFNPRLYNTEIQLFLLWKLFYISILDVGYFQSPQ